MQGEHGRMDTLTTTKDGRALGDQSRRVLRYVVMLSLAVLIMAANVMIFRQIDVQLKRSYTAETDSAPWVLAQVEVELLRYVLALQSVRSDANDPSVLEEVRLSYDLLYSRAKLVDRHVKLSHLPLITSADWLAVNGPGGMIERTEPLIDGADEALLRAVPALLTEARAATRALRADIVFSMQASLRMVEVQRSELRASLQMFSAVSLGLLGVMAALMITIYLQGRNRERHRRELAQAVYNLRTTIDSSLEAAVILDHDGRVMGCNRAGAAMFGWDESGQFVRYFTDVLRDARRGGPGLIEIAQACAVGKEGEQGRITLTGYRQNGQTFPVEVSIAQARSAVGLPIAIAFLRDISEQVEREETLRQARNAALQGEEAKSRFLAMMSHEMRTPLNGLLSAVELLTASTRLDAKQIRLVNIVETCGRTTLDQVNNVLELTRLRSAEGSSYPDSDFALTDLVNTVAGQFELDAQKRGNRVTVRYTGEEPPRLYGQRQLLSRVLSNIVSNAVKFTEDGKITIAIDTQTGRAADTYALRLSVTDTGVGIAEEDRDRIFRAFETLDSTYARMQDGSGLGLGLAKLAAEAMGGRITVTSRAGEGSTFAVFLTMAKSRAAMKPISRLRPLSLLVVEDNPVNRELLVELLRLNGHRVTAAQDGAEGVQKAEAERPDAILMDVSMPVMDGLEATRAIRNGTLSRDVPIIGVTAHADPDKRLRFMEQGMTEVLMKPVDLRKLEETLIAHVPNATTDMIGEPSHLRLVTVNTREPAAAPPARVEVAEDLSLPDDLPPLLDDEILDDLKETLGAPYMAKMASRFVNETDAALTAMGAHAAEGDLPQAAQVAHKNAGAAASLGLKALHRLFVVYERQAKAGDGGSADKTRNMIAQIHLDTVNVLRERGLTA